MHHLRECALSKSPWKTNDVLSCSSPPCSQTDKVEAYNAGKLMSMQMTVEGERERERDKRGEMKAERL